VNSVGRQAARVLVVEDEPKLVALLGDYLRAAGYEVDSIIDGLDVVPSVRARPPHLMLLDLTLPGRDGVEICRDVRTFSEVPIVIITARVDELDRLIGLEIGADDYICKPFSPREVVARARAILRRARTNSTPLAACGLLIDEPRHQAEYKNQALDLTPIEFRLLRTLASSPGRVFSRQHLLEKLYSDHRVVTDRTVDSHVKNLRRKLQAVDPETELVHSIYGLGYKLDF
jgi:two-component system response regulator BaeR